MILLKMQSRIYSFTLDCDLSAHDLADAVLGESDNELLSFIFLLWLQMFS